jgi:predicted nucleic acid-binding protein
MKLFDTSVLVEQIRKGVFESGAISIMTLIEVLRGVPQGKRERVKRLLEESYEVLGLNNDAILKYCEIYEELKRRGELLPDADLLIAAIAMAHGYTLVTKDLGFKRLEALGVKLELRGW